MPSLSHSLMTRLAVNSVAPDISAMSWRESGSQSFAGFRVSEKNTVAARCMACAILCSTCSCANSVARWKASLACADTIIIALRENAGSCRRQLSKAEAYTQPEVKFGFCRGLEPVMYVTAILDRFQHYKQFVTPDTTVTTRVGMSSVADEVARGR